ncbi:Fur family transcriptional regulator [Veronia pacifica]|uniref:Fur family transcriptional regulator n=1 Tax=Veronia pacifica TaxID=1080227 RepID=A0A1C3E9C9_9GAMM|nr:transcriptional repressor [Veronia pacifica]ODA29821.1 Fur family transcriptional regulator [Veronia pacifica]
MDVINENNGTIKRAERYCDARGLRLTKKRKQVLAGLIQSRKALSAYELITYCEDHLGETIPAMSMYRILEFLNAENLVHKISMLNKYVVCEHINCKHDHGIPEFLVCSQCNKVKETIVAPSAICQLQENAEEAGFTLTSPQLEMNCVCKECMEPDKKRS